MNPPNRKPIALLTWEPSCQKRSASRRRNSKNVTIFPVVPGTKKYCTTCQKIKPSGEFHDPKWDRCKTCHNKNSNARYHSLTPEKKKDRQKKSRLRNYGLTQEQYDTLMAKQNGKCANKRCPVEFVPGVEVHIDHDHDTGVVRGLLCERCNVLEGLLKSAEAALGLYKYMTTNVTRRQERAA